MTAFSELTVLSLEQATTLPFLTQRLAREGMRVIRVEPPGRGDPNRYIGEATLDEADMCSYFFPNNCGKEAITLNLRAPEGQALLHDLITRLPVDIFATNNRPRTYAKLGIAYEKLRSVRPDLIWLGTTGFGPQSDEGAYDPVIQARAGWMELTGEPDGFPQVVGLPLVDLGASEHAYGAVMKALFQRASTGAGSRIDISLFHSALSWMANAVMLTELGEHITRRGNTHQFFGPVSVFPTKDERFVYLATGNDRQWKALTQLDGFKTLADTAYAQNAGRMADIHSLNERIAAITRQRTAAELISAMNAIGTPIAKVNTMAEVVQEPLLREGMTRSRDARSGVEVVLPPLAQTNAESAPTLTFPPRLGEHNETIFGEVLGLSAEQIAGLGEKGII